MRPTEEAEAAFHRALAELTTQRGTPVGRYHVHLVSGLLWLAKALRATYLKLEELDRASSPDLRSGGGKRSPHPVPSGTPG